MAKKGKESDRESNPKQKSGEHRKQNQGGNKSKKWWAYHQGASQTSSS